jgi:hypothetical protein
MRQAWVPMKCGKSSLSTTAHFELEGGCWNLASTALAPATATRAHTEESPMAGQFGISETYAGCAGCRADGYVRCGVCNELGCWNTAEPMFRCGWCGNTGPVSGNIESLDPADWG